MEDNQDKGIKNMNPDRISIAVDDETLQLLEEIDSEEDASRSKIVREAIKFYHENKKFRKLAPEKLETYIELLLEGEHVVLDVDHWLLLLEILENSSEKEKFWKLSKKVADSHADQLGSKVQTPEDLLRRLSACNFFRLNKISDNDFSLVINSERAKKFVRRILEDFSDSMGFEIEIQEDIGKLRVKNKNSDQKER